jgi:NAD(P)-dependent dehydrogenase (short-subunit alcohol dehydrogenase family)
LAGHKVLITGASRGIGRAIALGMAKAGADVALIARSEAPLAELANEIRQLGPTAAIRVADVTNTAQLTQAINELAGELGGLTCVVANAGGNNFSANFTEIRTRGWQKTLDLNLNSVIATLNACAPHLAQNPGRASAINVASVAAIRAVPTMSHYGAAKAAVVSLTQTLAAEWAAQGIRVNALLPGWVATNLTEFLRQDPAREQALLKRIPLKRWADPAEIAAPAVFLASDAASYITGQVLIVDGGLTL